MPTLLAAITVFSLVSTPEAMTSTTQPSDARPPRDRFVLSARGPSDGRATQSAGGSVLVILPMLDLRRVHGGSGGIQAEARVKTLGILSFFDTAARFRLVDSEAFSFALFAGLDATVVLGEREPRVGESQDEAGLAQMANTLSGGGGFLMSAGPEWWQWTLRGGAYLGWSFSEGREVVTLEASLGTEFPVGDSVSLFIEAGVDTYGLPVLVPIPTLSIGVGW